MMWRAEMHSVWGSGVPPGVLDFFKKVLRCPGEKRVTSPLTCLPRPVRSPELSQHAKEASRGPTENGNEAQTVHIL